MKENIITTNKKKFRFKKKENTLSTKKKSKVKQERKREKVKKPRSRQRYETQNQASFKKKVCNHAIDQDKKNFFYKFPPLTTESKVIYYTKK